MLPEIEPFSATSSGRARRARRALVRATQNAKTASPVLLIERHAPEVRLSCPKKCEEQDAAKILNLKYPKHDFRAHFLSKQANFG